MPQPKKSKSTALTKEHFDQALKNLPTKADLDRKLVDSVKHVMGHTNTQISRIESKLDEMDEGINIKLDAIHPMLDIRDRVTRLEEQVKQLQK